MNQSGRSPQDSNPFGQKPSFDYAPLSHSPYAPRAGVETLPPPAGETNKAGWGALICGLLSLTMLCPFSIAAIVLGIVGLRRRTAKGTAIAGLVLGCVTLTTQVVLGCLVLAVYGTAMAFITEFTAAFKPLTDTQKALDEAAATVERRFAETGTYPEDAEGEILLERLRDGWGGPVAYQRDEKLGYVVRTPGPDGQLDTDDDYRYSPRYATLADPTLRAVAQGREIVDLNNDYDEAYPTSEEGGALIAHLKDEWDRPLVYRQLEAGDDYLVISLGADGALDTEDDVTTVPESAYLADANERALYRAAELVDEASWESGTYPSDEQGAALIEKEGIEDEWGARPVYRRKQAGQSYAILSLGPDGMSDTADDLVHSPDSPYIANPTMRALRDANVRIEDAAANAESYPADVEGQELVADLLDEWGRPVVYRSGDDRLSYRVFSSGPDGLPDTDDDVAEEGMSLWEALAD